MKQQNNEDMRESTKEENNDERYTQVENDITLTQ